MEWASLGYIGDVDSIMVFLCFIS